MEITDVRVYPVNDEKLKAYVSVVLDGCFMINDVKVVSGRDGLFISMPSRKRKNGEYKDVAHPLNQETRRRFEERILAQYRVACGAAHGLEDGVELGSAGEAGALTPEAAADFAASALPSGVGGRLATAAAVVLLSLPVEMPTSPLDELERKHRDANFWGVE